MKTPAIFLSAVALASPLHADLPMLEERPWLGSFIAFKDKGARFLLSSKGNAMFEPLQRDRSPIAVTNPVKVKFDIYETLPSGKTVRKKIDSDAFTSDSPATLDPKQPVTIRGTVTGGAKFEITVSGDGGEVSFSGRIVEKGSLTNPLHLAISIDFDPYKSISFDNDGQKETFEKKIRRDEIRIELPERKSKSLPFLEAKNTAEEAKGGFSAAEIRMEGYGGLRWNLTASPNSTLRFEADRERPLWEGFTITWTLNEGADPAQGEFTIEHT